MSGRRSRGKSDAAEEKSAKRRRLSPTKKSEEYLYFEDGSMTNDESVSEGTVSDYEENDTKTPSKSHKKKSVSTGKKKAVQNPPRRSSTSRAELRGSKLESPVTGSLRTRRISDLGKNDPKTPSKSHKKKIPSTSTQKAVQNPSRRNSTSQALLNVSKVESSDAMSSPGTPGERSKRIRKPVNRGEDFIYYEDKADAVRLAISNEGVKVIGTNEKEISDEAIKEEPKTPKNVSLISTPKPTKMTPLLSKKTPQPSQASAKSSLARHTPRLNKKEREDLAAAGEYSWIIRGPRAVVELIKLEPEEIEAILCGTPLPRELPKQTAKRSRGRPSKAKPQPEPVKKQKVVRIIKDGKTTVIRPLKEGESAKRSPVGRPRTAALLRPQGKDTTPKSGTKKVPDKDKEEATPTEKAVKLPAGKTPTNSGKKVAQVTPQPNRLTLQKLADGDVKKDSQSPEKFILTRSPPGAKGKGTEKDQYVLCMNEDGQLMYLPADVVLSNTTGSVRAEVTVPDSTLSSNKHHIMIGDASSVKVRVRKEQVVTSGGSVKKIVKDSMEEVVKTKGNVLSPAAKIQTGTVSNAEDSEKKNATGKAKGKTTPFAKPKTMTVLSPAEIEKKTIGGKTSKPRKTPETKKQTGKQKSQLWSTDSEIFGGPSPIKTQPKVPKVVAEKEKPPLQDFVLCLNKDDGEFVYISRDLLKGCSNLQPVDSKSGIVPKKGSIILKSPQKGPSLNIAVPSPKPDKVVSPPKPAEQETNIDKTRPEDSGNQSEDDDDDDWGFTSPAKSDSDDQGPEFYICEKTGDIMSRSGETIDPAIKDSADTSQASSIAIDLFIGSAAKQVEEEKAAEVEKEALGEQIYTGEPATFVQSSPFVSSESQQAGTFVQSSSFISSDSQQAETNVQSSSVVSSDSQQAGTYVQSSSVVSSDSLQAGTFVQSSSVVSSDSQQAGTYVQSSSVVSSDSQVTDINMQIDTQAESLPATTTAHVAMETSTPDESTMAHHTAVESLMSLQSSALPQDVTMATSAENEAAPSQSIMTEAETTEHEPEEQVMYQITHPDGTTTVTDTLPTDVMADQAQDQDQPQEQAQDLAENQEQTQDQAPASQSSGVIYEITQPDGTTIYTDTIPPEMAPQEPQQQVMYQITNPDGTVTYSDTIPEGCQLAPAEEPVDVQEEPQVGASQEPEISQESEPEVIQEPEPEVMQEPEPQIPQEPEPEPQVPQEPQPKQQKLMYQITQPDGTTYLTETLPEGVTLVGDDGMPLDPPTNQDEPQVTEPEVQHEPYVTQGSVDTVAHGTKSAVPSKERIILQQGMNSRSLASTSFTHTVSSQSSSPRPMGTVMSDEFGPAVVGNKPRSTPKSSPAVILMKKTPKGGMQRFILPPTTVSRSLEQSSGATKTFSIPSQKKSLTIVHPPAKTTSPYTMPSTSYKQSPSQSREDSNESAFSILSSLGQSSSSPAKTMSIPGTSSQTKYIVLQTSSGQVLQVPVSGAAAQRSRGGAGMSLLKKTLTEASASPPSQRLIDVPKTQTQTPVTLPMDILQQALSTADIDEEQAKNLSALYQ